jgi:hypothetical protein
MRLRNILTRRKPRPSTRPMLTDWTTSWTTRDWADLPPHHPRREEDAIR